jgi:prefoldin subunit 5
MSNDDMSTKPTIETVLERVNAWGEQFKSEFAEIRAGQDELRKSQEELRNGQEELRNGQEGLRKGQEEFRKGQEELRIGQKELRADLNAGLHRVARKIEVLNDNLLTVQANIRDLVVRTEKLEAESLAPK